jgi:hypothetical protein
MSTDQLTELLMGFWMKAHRNICNAEMSASPIKNNSAVPKRAVEPRLLLILYEIVDATSHFHTQYHQHQQALPIHCSTARDNGSTYHLPKLHAVLSHFASRTNIPTACVPPAPPRPRLPRTASLPTRPPTALALNP